MLNNYTLGQTLSDIGIAMPYMAFVASMSAYLVFRKCKSKQTEEEIRKLYRALSITAESFGMVALFGIAIVFGRALVAFDKDQLSNAHNNYVMMVHDLVPKIRFVHCFHREKDGVTFSFRENFNPICNVTDLRNWNDQDVGRLEEQLKEFDRITVFSAPTETMSLLSELKLNIQGTLETQRQLWVNHGPWISTAQSPFAIAQLAFAVICALLSTSMKTGKAFHEWYAGRK